MSAPIATEHPALPPSWRFFDNGGETFDRWSVWEGDGWFCASDNPFDPQGIGQHSEGLPPDALRAWRPEWRGREVPFEDLPPAVQRAVLQDAKWEAAA